MENANSDKFFKFIVAWAVGMICLPGLSFVVGAVLTSLVKVAAVQGVAVFFFFLGYYGFFPCLAFTALLALFCALLTPTVKKAILYSALLNVGVIVFLAMFVSGVFSF